MLANALSLYGKAPEEAGTLLEVTRALNVIGIDIKISGVGVSQSVALAYLIGLIKGVLAEQYTHEDIRIAGQEAPVRLIPALTELYGRYRVELMVAGVTTEPFADSRAAAEARIASLQKPAGTAQPTALQKILDPLKTKDISNYTVYVNTTMKVVNALSVYARTSPDDQKLALATILDLLRLYGERAMKLSAEEQTFKMAPALIKDILGAA
ncbi:MAG: hypothetical protein ABSH12_09845, partial [Endomicrobiales bacterium]|jgi:hypothetical protein